MEGNEEWKLYSFEELTMMESHHPVIPEALKQANKLQKAKEIIERHFHHLADGTGKHIRIEQHTFLIMKSNSKKTVGIAVKKNRSVNKGNEKEKHEAKVESFVFHSQKMNDVMDLVRKVSFVDSTVLLLGKTGVGKSRIARKIHQYSQRSGKTFAEINCSAIPESLLEAELFGYTAGSFTGGEKKGKQGIFQSSTGGTVFLDEIGEVPFHLQAKLLGVLQENQIRPIGSAYSIPVDVRIIAATNQNLEEMVKKKLFREDLFYRLNVVPISIPSLSERTEDIEYLSNHFLDLYNTKYQMNKLLAPEVLDAFSQYDWPGNVRELENMVERLLITAEGQWITEKQLPNYMMMKQSQPKDSLPHSAFPPLKEAKKQLEKELIINAYSFYRNTYKVAEVLKVNQSTIAKKVKQFRDEGVF